MEMKTRSIRLPLSLDYEIDKYATTHQITYSEAVRILCNRTLHSSFDEHYAPKIENVIQKENYKIVNHFESLLEQYSEDTAIRVFDYLKYLIENKSDIEE